MKREIFLLIRVDQCCPGHDDWPNQTYKNNRSKRARSNDIKKEHRFVRRKQKHLLRTEMML
jgi:hypothetical protein